MLASYGVSVTMNVVGRSKCQVVVGFPWLQTHQVPERVRKGFEKKAAKVELVERPVVKNAFGTIRLVLRHYRFVRLNVQRQY